jgi:glycosyltransferase involved in cell wall biosynthesis
MYPIGDKPMTVVRNGVDAEFFAPAAWDAAAKEIREEYAWGSQIIIMYAGYLDEVNGIRFVVECLSQLPPEVQGKVRFVFLGRGPNARMLEKAQEEYPELVQYIGSVAYDRIPSFYGACDVFMVPRPSTAPAESLLPVKLLEAMAMEKAVLVSDVAAMAETVAHGESGLVFRKGEPASFVEEVTGIARGKYDLSGLGVRAREIVASEFSWKRSAAATRAAYRQALGDG